MLNKRFYFPLATLIIAVLACNLPESTTPGASGPNAAFTAAAQTVEAQLTGAALTQAASAASVTDTPTPPAGTITATPSPSTTSAPILTPTSTQICDQAQFITDVTVPDGATFEADAAFTKTWRLKNIGACSWTSSYTLAFASGNSMNGPTSLALSGNVNHGDTIDISVNLKAPSAAGDYTGYWKLRNAAGVSFITITVVIHVGSGSGGGPFAVIHVYYTTTTWNGSGFVNCPQVNAAIVTNGAGTVQYHWVRDDGDSTSGTLTFAAAGSQTVSAQWSLGSFWVGHDNWMGIYIDSPNHQAFGHTAVTPCTSP